MLTTLQMRNAVRAIVLPVTIAACDRSPTSVGASVSSLQQDAPPVTVRELHHRSYDDVMAEVDSASPGFAGAFIDETGTLVVRDVRQVSNGEDRANQLASALSSRLLTNVAAGRKVRRESADFSFAQLRDWLRALMRVRLPSDVATFDIDERRNRLVVGLTSMSAIPAMEAAVKSAGVPLHALVLEKAPRTTLLQAGAFPNDTSLRHPVRPLVGGVKIDVEAVGTSGGPCTAGFTLTVGGVPSFVTVSHCTTNYASYDNGRIRQPGQLFYFGTIFDFFIGRESVDVPHQWGLGDGHCPYSAVGCRWSDAAVIGVDPGIPVSVGRIARASQTNGSMVLGGYPPSVLLAQNSGHWRVLGREELFPPLPGAPVMKIGAATDQTTGAISRTYIYEVRDPSAPMEQKWLLCQFEVTGPAYCGDSGGPVVGVLSSQSGTVALLGIAYSGIEGSACNGSPFIGYRYSPITGVIADLYNAYTPWSHVAP